MEEAKNNKAEAEVLIDYAKIECDDVKIVLSMLDAILTNKTPGTLDGWNWKIAKFIEGRTNYITVEIDPDVDIEEGDWGIPIIVSGAENPTGITIQDKCNLIILRKEVDDILNHTRTDRIYKFISLKNKPKWKCQKCGRYFKKELSSLDEIKKLLRSFDIGKYWKCRSCKTLNYFEFNDDGIIFKEVVD